MEKLELTIGEETYLWSDMIVVGLTYDERYAIEQIWKGRSFISKDRTNIIHYGSSDVGFHDVAGVGEHEEYNELFFNLKKNEVWIKLSVDNFDQGLVYVKQEDDVISVNEEFYLKVKETYDASRRGDNND